MQVPAQHSALLKLMNVVVLTAVASAATPFEDSYNKQHVRLRHSICCTYTDLSSFR